jgi:DNA modification methylase
MIEETVEIFPSERQRLYDKFADKLETASHLSRKVVSFQANKDEPVYRWFKYKEGFSSTLVKYFLTEYSKKPGKLLDPFAGAGTALFAGQELGWDAHGIELLPVGIFVMEAKEAFHDVEPERLSKTIHDLWIALPNIHADRKFINHISITKDAFSDETEASLNNYLTFCESIEDKKIQTILKFAAFCVLEEISYTRKDGQYLRWDYRSKRDLAGKPFDKGKIHSFEDAIKRKLSHIVSDLSPQNESLFEQFESNGHHRSSINVIEGSCLEKLPKLESDSFNFIFTSPPYCNRYDYTRTYALELIFLGCDSDKVRSLRQDMLSCTVENKEKLDYLHQFYSSIGNEETFDKVLKVYNSSPAMTEVNFILDELNKLDKLNNNNVPRMVKNYFLELCFVIYEMSRVLKRDGYCIMVNDNVRYGGEEIPVDLILSEFAEQFGFNINKIFVLPQGKGNSSQQMGSHGRVETRKCVYLWQKKS